MNATKQGIEMRAKIKQAIISYMEKHGYAPTIREIGDMVGLSSTSSVHNHLIRMIATLTGCNMPVKKYTPKNIRSDHMCAIATVNEKEPVLGTQTLLGAT